jgi:hypothetical protein
VAQNVDGLRRQLTEADLTWILQAITEADDPIASWELKEFLLHEDWVLVTWNCKDFRGPRTCRAREECSQMFRFMPALSASMGQLGWTSNFSGFFFSLSSKNLITNRTLRIKFWKSRSTSRVRE